MPLERKDYNPLLGEHLPHSDDTPYLNRVRSHYLFRSKNNEPVLATSNVLFTNAVNVGSTDSMGPTWPLEINGEVPTELAIAGGLDRRIYQINYSESSQELTITINGHLPLETYELLFPDDPEAAQNAFANDFAIFTEYKNNLQKILDDNNEDGLVGNFLGFNWGTVTASGFDFDCSDIISTVNQAQILTDSEPQGVSRAQFVVKLTVQNNQPFPNGMIPEAVNFWATDSVQGIVEWNPSLTDSVLVGDIIQLDASFGIVPNQYLYLDSDGSLGRYFVTDVHDGRYLFVNRVDGQEFQVGGPFTNVAIKNISLQPRLKIKYTLPERGGIDDDPQGAIYRFYSILREDETYTPLATNGTQRPELVMESDESQSLIEGSDSLFTVGGSRDINVINFASGGNLSWGVKTTLEDQTTEGNDPSVRVSPWRKGYRAANRFVPKEVTLRKRKESTSTNAILKSDLTLGMSRNNNSTESMNFPEAMLHSPSLAQLSNVTGSGNGGNGQILYTTAKLGNVELVSGSLGNDTAGNLMASGFDHTIERSNDDDLGLSGYILQSSVPNKISFTANMDHSGNANGSLPAFDFSGKVSTKYGVIPAYSGEITAADNVATRQMSPEHGFIEFNYTNSDLSLVNQFAVFIDISETDEVLRWNGSNYDPDEVWRNTFTTLQVRNKTTNKIINIGSSTSPNYSLKKNSKTNYVIIMHTDMSEIDPSFTISTDDVIELEFLNKKVIENYLSADDPSNPETSYVPINYRPLEDESKDDFFLPEIERNLSDFTITSDGLLETGNITINYDGDVPDDTEFRLFIEDDEEDSP